MGEALSATEKGLVMGEDEKGGRLGGCSLVSVLDHLVDWVMLPYRMRKQICEIGEFSKKLAKYFLTDRVYLIDQTKNFALYGYSLGRSGEN